MKEQHKKHPAPGDKKSFTAEPTKVIGFRHFEKAIPEIYYQEYGNKIMRVQNAIDLRTHLKKLNGSVTVVIGDFDGRGANCLREVIKAVKDHGHTRKNKESIKMVFGRISPEVKGRCRDVLSGIEII